MTGAIHRRRLLAWTAASLCSGALAQEDGPGSEKLKQLLQQRKNPGQLTPERLARREALLREGEALLASRRSEAAVAKFDEAAAILHAADTEISLVRGYMQLGQYRRALAYGAHTAGAHLDVVGGTALYAWLLHAGAQPDIARKLLADADARAPAQPLVRAVQAQLASNRPLAHGALLQPPVRLAPYADSDIAAGRLAAGAVLLADGRHALSPRVRGQAMMVRNGLGDESRVRPLRTVAGGALQLWQLVKPLDAPQAWSCTGADPFPGSVALVAGYARAADPLPAWPLLHAGFVGTATPAAGRRRLDATPAGWLPGALVCDGSGSVCGITLGDTLLGAGHWQGDLGQSLAPVRNIGPLARTSVDMVYETALRLALQLVAGTGRLQNGRAEQTP